MCVNTVSGESGPDRDVDANIFERVTNTVATLPASYNLSIARPQCSMPVKAGWSRPSGVDLNALTDGQLGRAGRLESRSARFLVVLHAHLLTFVSTDRATDTLSHLTVLFRRDFRGPAIQASRLNHT
jgi:hypothetical protein